MRKRKTGGVLYTAMIAGLWGLSTYAVAQPVQPSPTYPAGGTPTTPSMSLAQPLSPRSGRAIAAPGRSSTDAAKQDQISIRAAGDPPQWYKEDVTSAQQYQTARKEAGAAYNQAMAHCRKLAGAERTVCLSEARTTYNDDLAALKRQYEK
jgi:hypothetical protein